MFLTSCEKDKNPQFNEVKCESNCFEIVGIVREGQSGMTLDGVNVEVSKRYNQYLSDLLVTTSTDSNGVFNAELPVSYFVENETNESLNLSMSKNGYIDDPHRDFILLDSSDIDTPVILEYFLYKYSKLKVNLQNNPDTDFGYISVGVNWELDSILPVGDATYDGEYFEPFFEFKVPSDVPVFIDWKTDGGEIEVSGETELVVPADSIMEFDIYL